MVNQLVDPNTLEAPNFALEHYAGSRRTLVEAGLTEEQAVDVLTRTWHRTQLVAWTKIDDEALTMRTNNNGTASWVPAASVRGAKAIPDGELTWEQLSEAVPRFIVAMQQAKWAADRVPMLAQFWGNLQMHPFH
ncbi:hypothetical protein FOMPIDRAFT_1049722 [Fomitopsis schrenkii]|uniref:Uncharacterized protein n=1 Tax=Fomitopsis schrenkii TaxID=2126942 RepID=S8E5Q9_FOMSC|nr:hypothetical protein FOMPIDRAFT_1049722 [Fomitopsis schrenkii]